LLGSAPGQLSAGSNASNDPPTKLCLLPSTHNIRKAVLVSSFWSLSHVESYGIFFKIHPNAKTAGNEKMIIRSLKAVTDPAAPVLMKVVDHDLRFLPSNFERIIRDNRNSRDFSSVTIDALHKIFCLPVKS
jgi:hypothetical protein